MRKQAPLQIALDFYNEIPPEIQWGEEEVEVLRYGILKDALHLICDKRNSLRERVDTLVWIEGERDDPFSFKVCCEASGLDPDELHGRILSMLRQQHDDEGDLGLLSLILEDATGQLLKTSAKPDVRVRVLHWLHDDSSEKLYSFRACCRAAGLNPEVHRAEVLARLSQASALDSTERQVA